MPIDVFTQVRLQWHGSDGSRFIRSFNAAANDAAYQAAKAFKQELQRKIQLRVVKLKSGKVVLRSRPGEPPRREFGNLWRGIAIHQDRRNMITSIYTNVIYARALELGSSTAKRTIRPRPAWIPTFLIMHKRMSGIINGWMQTFIGHWRP